MVTLPTFLCQMLRYEDQDQDESEPELEQPSNQSSLKPDRLYVSEGCRYAPGDKVVLTYLPRVMEDQCDTRRGDLGVLAHWRAWPSTLGPGQTAQKGQPRKHQTPRSPERMEDATVKLSKSEYSGLTGSTEDGGGIKPSSDAVAIVHFITSGAEADSATETLQVPFDAIMPFRRARDLPPIAKRDSGHLPLGQSMSSGAVTQHQLPLEPRDAECKKCDPQFKDVLRPPRRTVLRRIQNLNRIARDFKQKRVGPAVGTLADLKRARRTGRLAAESGAFDSRFACLHARDGTAHPPVAHALKYSPAFGTTFAGRDAGSSILSSGAPWSPPVTLAQGPLQTEVQLALAAPHPRQTPLGDNPDVGIETSELRRLQKAPFPKIFKVHTLASKATSLRVSK